MVVFWRRKFAKMALPLHCNRITVTVLSRHRYGETALPLRCNGDAITPKRQKFWARNPPTVLSNSIRLPFSRSIWPCFQVLNFSNNILQFQVVASGPLSFFFMFLLPFGLPSITPSAFLRAGASLVRWLIRLRSISADKQGKGEYYALDVMRTTLPSSVLANTSSEKCL